MMTSCPRGWRSRRAVFQGGGWGSGTDPDVSALDDFNIQACASLDIAFRAARSLPWSWGRASGMARFLWLRGATGHFVRMADLGSGPLWTGKKTARAGRIQMCKLHPRNLPFVALSSTSCHLSLNG